MRACICVLGLFVLILAGGCGTPKLDPVDAKANYGYVFGGIHSPQPEIIHSRVERPYHTILGVYPIHSQYNGDWEFELVASRAWVKEVKDGFVEIPFSEVAQRPVPEWFTPSATEFTAWRVQATSYPNAHLFIEKDLASQDRVRVFMRRH